MTGETRFLSKGESLLCGKAPPQRPREVIAPGSRRRKRDRDNPTRRANQQKPVNPRMRKYSASVVAQISGTNPPISPA